MINKKQSSVEWLDRWFRDNPEATHEEGNTALQQAKAMHIEEMEHFFKGGMSLVEGRLWKPIDMFDEYYNKTFEGNK